MIEEEVPLGRRRSRTAREVSRRGHGRKKEGKIIQRIPLTDLRCLQLPDY
jgi:hypothetical protein